MQRPAFTTDADVAHLELAARTLSANQREVVYLGLAGWWLNAGDDELPVKPVILTLLLPSP